MEQRERTRILLQARGVSRALFADFFSVKWLTGFFQPVGVGPSFFSGGPALVWYEDGHFTLVVADVFGDAARLFDGESDGTAVTYPGYIFEQPIAAADHLRETLHRLFAASSLKKGKIGLEEAAVTSLMAHVVRENFPAAAEMVAIDGWLEPLRMVKTAEELTKLRQNFALTDLGQAVARQSIAAGKREIDVWTAVHSAIQQKAGQRVALGNDCVVGHRQGNIGGWPLNFEIRSGDSLIVDLSTQFHGYWSDSCATYYADEPTARQKAIHQTVTEALELAVSLVRPGVVAREIDQKVREFIAQAGYLVYPHHTGHGVGASGHEAPRIVPYNDEVLQEGMVIMLEPGIYFPGETGVRLEDAVLVNAGGAELLTHHDKSLP
jgi:Xaa-Pro aminopeptidase